jgi:hypothetical protein
MATNPIMLNQRSVSDELSLMKQLGAVERQRLLLIGEGGLGCGGNWRDYDSAEIRNRTSTGAVGRSQRD